MIDDQIKALDPVSRMYEVLIKTARSTGVWPLLVLCGVAFAISFILGFSSEGAAQIFFLVFGAIAFFVFVGFFLFFAIVDRDFLRSEEHQQSSRVLDLIENKAKTIRISPVSLTPSANTYIQTTGTKLIDQ